MYTTISWSKQKYTTPLIELGYSNLHYMSIVDINNFDFVPYSLINLIIYLGY